MKLSERGQKKKEGTTKVKRKKEDHMLRIIHTQICQYFSIFSNYDFPPSSVFSVPAQSPALHFDLAQNMHFLIQALIFLVFASTFTSKSQKRFFFSLSLSSQLSFRSITRARVSLICSVTLRMMTFFFSKEKKFFLYGKMGERGVVCCGGRRRGPDVSFS